MKNIGKKLAEIKRRRVQRNEETKWEYLKPKDPYKSATPVIALEIERILPILPSLFERDDTFYKVLK